jgi:hypothetical protein
MNNNGTHSVDFPQETGKMTMLEVARMLRD